ncbi:hypothetical protein SOVF_208560 [Spinacia oleracea]|nr:hypothetical protein SOVF_208560 [Spinacia oleracea]
MSNRFSRTIYVGNLPSDIKERDIEDLFYKYGRILEVETKVPPRPPCFCFVEFEGPRDADQAIRGRDGYNFDGCHLRVELAHGGRGSGSSSSLYILQLDDNSLPGLFHRKLTIAHHSICYHPPAALKVYLYLISFVKISLLDIQRFRVEMLNS